MRRIDEEGEFEGEDRALVFHALDGDRVGGVAHALHQ